MFGGFSVVVFLLALLVGIGSAMVVSLTYAGGHGAARQVTRARTRIAMGIASKPAADRTPTEVEYLARHVRRYPRGVVAGRVRQ